MVIRSTGCSRERSFAALLPLPTARASSYEKSAQGCAGSRTHGCPEIELEAPLTLKPRNPRALRGATTDFARPQRCRRRRRIPSIAGPPRGRRPGDLPAATFRCARRRGAAFGETPHGAFPVWPCGRYKRRDRSLLERESNPRLSVSGPMLYPTELSNWGGRPESNRRPTARAVALPLSYIRLVKHRLARLGIRHGSAARTGREFTNPRR